MGFKLGLAQCRHPKDGDVVAMVDEWAGRASAAGVDLLVFPESLMTPFELSREAFAESAEPLDGPFASAVDALAAKHGLWMAYTLNERGAHAESRRETPSNTAEAENGQKALPYNTAIIVDSKGRKQRVYRKVHLFDTDFVRESDKVAAGDSLAEPLETPFGRIGLAICYDLRFPEQARAAALAGCQVMLYPAAWVDGPRKVDHWRTLLRARAIENQMFVAGLSRCDRAFGAAQRDYAGHSCVFAPSGDLVAEAAGTEEQLVLADIDLALVAETRAAMPCLDHRRADLY